MRGLGTHKIDNLVAGLRVCLDEKEDANAVRFLGDPEAVASKGS